ncbi:histidine kinase-like ATPase, C-terminal domain-containing protein [Artemisia annua]|uniref:Histidine kinase-like ATPase, C-terminal domain-containing protein n=1 Tax=Artemisia annua TaxID=35608 RepID=A0A2U1LTH0_ARTAN|nr:histidine kinase-like ATPase, C-terminal domain-containing protein [Artemisia annua]
MYGHNRRQRNKGGTSRNAESQVAVIDAAVKKAHSDLLAAGESVMVWRVSQAALVMLKADSFESLGCRMQNVPSLYQIIITEAKVNSFINCFVAVQKITSLHDLVLAICENEGIKSFEELELGPILKHPLVVHYFSIGPDVTEICKITTEQIVAYLSILPRKKKKTMYAHWIYHRGRRSEGNVLKKCSVGLDLNSLINDEEDDETAAKDAANNNNDDAEAASTSDLSAASQIPRTWLDTELDCSLTHEITSCNDHGAPLKGKQVSKISYCTKYAIHKTPKKWIAGTKVKPEFLSDNVETGYIDDNAVDGHTSRFFKIWKESCEDENVVEAYDKMLDFYHGQMKPKKKTKAVNSMISSYPYVGLLNVDIASIKFGLWDRMSFVPEEINKVGHANVNSTTRAVDVKTDVQPSEQDVLVASKHASKGRADVLTFAKEYFLVSNQVLDNISTYPKKQLALLREICKLESSLTQHFSADDFATLGFGDIFTFLGEHISLLPTTWQDCFTLTDKVEKPSVKVCMSQSYLLEFLSEAANSLGERETLCNLMVSQLLKTQFPSAGLTLLEDEFTVDLLTNLSRSCDHVSSNIVLFSSTLSDFTAEKGFSDTHVGTNDVIELLLKAPMLVDLSLWSCWDYKFAPSLGPLVGWLLSNVTTKELLCLVTKDGKVLRLDHSATVDSFLESFLHGSSFETAVKLVSLIALYGGEQNVPLSLLKFHANNAFQSEPIASRFVLDCLGYIPKEFQHFAAELLVSALRSIIKDAQLAILSECKKSKESLEKKRYSSKSEVRTSRETSQPSEDGKRDGVMTLTVHGADDGCIQPMLDSERENKAANIIESIRIEEFGLDPNISKSESSILKKQHARLGRALHCLSTELYSQDSHFLLELVQNADDNVYPRHVEPTLTFILQEKSIIVLNNEQGFSAENIRALCDVGNSTKKTASSGYIGKKGIGFKSVFRPMLDSERENKAANIIESIRIEEFGLDPNISKSESSILKKQHARLGRALHCLSTELYSQDSHFLLELVQNADDNVYPRHVEPTLTFILQEKSIIILNNEQGFSAENIRALCDVGNSTKKTASSGYIGKKGIGFKSVFRVTDAPEIHSNGFHIKFDLTNGQIGFVLPTIVPPCDISYFTNLVSFDTTNQVSTHDYNTCIVLPLKSKSTETSAEENIKSMFSDLHPSLLLFLHRLQCIKFRDMLNDSFVIMRKQITGNGLTNVSIGNETLTWFVNSQELQANVSRNGNYIPKLDQQNVFAFLPLRTYGLKFIIQGDFVLPSSREEVDGDSPWNQFLLSEFPNLFVSSQRSFCSLPGFKDCPGKGISVFMSYVPLFGEVHGFFASLPRMIISKLCTSNCLLLEGENDKWVPPCRVLRNWNEQVLIFLPDSLIQTHLGLGYLNKDIVLSDSLARALGIEIYGPKILVKMLSSLCRTKDGLTKMGHKWLSSWLNELHSMSIQNTDAFKVGSDVMNTLRKTPFIPLLGGCYSSIEVGTIWMSLNGSWDNLEAFTRLFSNLRIVNPALFDGPITNNLSQMLSKVGVQWFSEHQLVKAHVLPAICDKKNIVNTDLMAEYLSFIMVHLQSSCFECGTEREDIISEVYNKAYILTNHGFALPSEVEIHFGNDFGNHIDISRLISGIDVKWYEVDKIYMMYPLGISMVNWRSFLQEVGITDFVQTVQVDKTVSISSQLVLTNMMSEKESILSIVTDWESRELVELLAKVSLSGDCEKCKHLLEVIDEIWDEYYSDKAVAYCNMDGESKVFKSSLVSALSDVQWVVSSIDNGLYYPKDLFYDCDAVCAILGDNASYAVPKIQNEKLVTSIGLKIAVTLHDALSVLEVWKRSATSFKASVSQMSRFYSFIWKELSSSDKTNMAILRSGSLIFVPLTSASSSEAVSGVLLSPQEVFWHDSMIHPKSESKMLSNLYPSLHDFFVNECGVNESPPLLDYLAFLRNLSTEETPSEAAKKVFDVFVMWSDGLKSGALSVEDVEMLKRHLEEKEMKVLPTSHDKWVSLHPSFGLVCWCDDEKLADEFEESNIINLFCLCELTDEEKAMLQMKISAFMKAIGIPALSEVVTREAIYYGPVDNSYETSLLSWALPYAQRYICNRHHERYLLLRLSGFEKLSRLQIVVVEKLFFKNVIRRSNLASKKRHDCSCLLQDDILYATRESDSHSVFMELTRFLINGDPELHLANFLHLITTMTESGSTEEQIQTFVLNSKKVPKLVDEEPIWSIQPMILNMETSTTTRVTKRTVKHSSSTGGNKNWPPSSWQSAPKMQDVAKRVDLKIPSTNQVEILEISTSSNGESDSVTNVANHVNVEPSLVDQDGPTSFSHNDQLSLGQVNVQHALLTGRRGEEVAFNYYSKKDGTKLVKWVNEASETGLPYDIEVYYHNNRKEYIEVKTTDSASKDWFDNQLKSGSLQLRKVNLLA